MTAPKDKEDASRTYLKYAEIMIQIPALNGRFQQTEQEMHNARDQRLFARQESALNASRIPTAIILLPLHAREAQECFS